MPTRQRRRSAVTRKPAGTVVEKRGTAVLRPHVGSEVVVELGADTRRARVVEDRGNLGVGGRRILRVALIGDDGDENVEFEVPAEALSSPDD
jgi:hypothetical protein